jgi:hypothetical protein
MGALYTLPFIKINQFILHRAKIAVLSEITAVHINRVWAEFVTFERSDESCNQVAVTI